MAGPSSRSALLRLLRWVAFVTFVPFSAGNKILLSSLLVICGEASFWIGVVFLGKEAVSKYRNIDWRSWVAGLFGISGKNNITAKEKEEIKEG